MDKALELVTTPPRELQPAAPVAVLDAPAVEVESQPATPVEALDAPPVELELPIEEISSPQQSFEEILPSRTEPVHNPVWQGIGIPPDLARDVVQYFLYCDLEAGTAAGVNVTNPPDHVYFQLLNQLSAELAPLAMDIEGGGVQVFAALEPFEARPFEVALIQMVNHLQRRAEIQQVEFGIDMEYLASLYPEAIPLVSSLTNERHAERQAEPALNDNAVVGHRSRDPQSLARSFIAGATLTSLLLSGSTVANHYLESHTGDDTDHQKVRVVPIPQFDAPIAGNVAAPIQATVAAPAVDDCAHVPPAEADLQHFKRGDYAAYAATHLNQAMRAVCSGTPSDLTEAKKQIWGYQWAAWELSEQDGHQADKVVSAIYQLGRDEIAPSEVTKLIGDANRAISPQTITTQSLR